MGNLETKDGFKLSKLRKTEYVYRIVKEFGKFRIKNMIVMQVLNHLEKITDNSKKEEYMKSIFSIKDLAEAEEFKLNKLLISSSDERYSYYLRQANTIIHRMSREELLDFVKKHKKD